MINLIIGLCFGFAAAGALLFMWRAAERLRRELLNEAETMDPTEPNDT